ncbi:MAG: hypothetical protein EOP88_19940 [Verrucomicrobiaceae bacterium]|nr:MAG: hypothetical protein EOP88_19940 [Verrucomicrobiaceae bacterium]
MKHLLMRQALRFIAVIAVPASLQCCAPSNQSTAHGENVSFYFNSSFACPEHVPEWQQVGEADLTSRQNVHPSPGDASDAFTKALVNLGQRSGE